MSLLEAMALVPAACSSAKACTELQAHCAASTDWRFRFGVAPVLLDVLQGTDDPAVRTAVLRGMRVKGKGECSPSPRAHHRVASKSSTHDTIATVTIAPAAGRVTHLGLLHTLTPPLPGRACLRPCRSLCARTSRRVVAEAVSRVQPAVDGLLGALAPADALALQRLVHAGGGGVGLAGVPNAECVTRPADPSGARGNTTSGSESSYNRSAPAPPTGVVLDGHVGFGTGGDGSATRAVATGTAARPSGVAQAMDGQMAVRTTPRPPPPPPLSAAGAPPARVSTTYAGPQAEPGRSLGAQPRPPTGALAGPPSPASPAGGTVFVNPMMLDRSQRMMHLQQPLP
jgi:hypothetical protein